MDKLIKNQLLVGLQLAFNDTLLFQSLKDSIYNYPPPSHIEDDLVYHYTDLNALKSIIESQSIWATHFDFLNDSKELRYGVELVKKVCQESGLESSKTICDKIISNVDRLLVTNRFIISTSKLRDSLDLWRLYGRSYTMVCIGLHFYKFKSSLYSHFETSHIIYDENRQRMLMRTILNDLIRFMYEYRPEGFSDSEYENFIVNTYIGYIESFITSFKSLDFSVEQEFRYIHIPKKKPSIKFRERNGILTPFIECKSEMRIQNEELQAGKFDDYGALPIITSPRISIQEIILGPNVEFDLNRKSLEMLLVQHGYSDIQISKSNKQIRH